MSEASLEIDHRIGKNSNRKIGGEFKIKSDFDKKGGLRGLEEQNSKGKVIKKLSVSRIVQKTTGKRRLDIEGR